VTVTIADAMRLTMAEAFARYVASQSDGCPATTAAYVELAAGDPGRFELRCILAPHDGRRHATLAQDGSLRRFEEAR
jgi:hypothetical protein